MPRRLEIVIEKLDLAKESFARPTPEWRILDDCQRQVQELLRQYESSNKVL